jgi:hypothetical protein
MKSGKQFTKRKADESSARGGIFVETKPDKFLSSVRSDIEDEMNNAGQKIAVGGICRPDGAGSVCGALATKMPLLTELGGNDVRLLKTVLTLKNKRGDLCQKQTPVTK